MSFRLISALGLLVASAPAFAANPDLTTSIAAPSGTYVYQTGRYNVTTSNIGNRDAAGVTLTIQLPATHTSPTVYVMGTLGATSASCATSGTRLVCNLGTIRRGRSTTVYFDLALPEAAEALVVSTNATTTTAGDPTGNNTASSTASLLNYAVAFSSGTVTNRHCTGTGLTSFFECELFPSSLSEHDAILNADHTVSFGPDIDPAYAGTWGSDAADHLWFVYTENGTVVAEFEGWGVDSNCWEGLTTFPGSSYVSPYEVCF